MRPLYSQTALCKEDEILDQILLRFVVILTVVGATVALAKAWRASYVSRILVGLLTLYFALWYFVPLCLNMLFWDKFPHHSVPESDYLLIAALEVGAFAAIIFAFLGWKTPIRIIQRSNINRMSVTPTALIGVALATALLATYFYITDAYGANYLERNAFQTTEAGSSAFERLGPLTMVTQAGLALLCAAIVKRTVPTLSKWITAILIAVILFYNYTQITGGSRIELLYPVIIFGLYALTHKWSRPQVLKTLLIIGPIVAVAISFITVAIESTRTTSSDATEGVGELTSTIGASDLRDLMVQSLVTKLDEFSPGAVLLGAFGPGNGGIKTYAGSVLGFLPRYFYSDKPVPGSWDGTYYGTPGRMVAAYSGSAADYGSTGIGVASIAAWQLGYVNLLFLVFCNVINLRILNTLLTSPSTAAWAAALWSIDLPAMMGLIATPDAILMSLQRLALAVLLLELFSKGQRKRGVRSTQLSQPRAINTR